MKTETIYLYKEGATHQLSGRRLAKLSRELKAGRGGPEVTALAMAGYAEFLGPDGERWGIEGIGILFGAS